MRPLEPVQVLELMPGERADLLDLLSRLRHEDWKRPTSCPGWSVRDLAAHVLGDDVGVLSRRRDAYRAPGSPGEGGSWDGLVAFINRANEAWVEATRRLSPRLLRDLLEYTGRETLRYFESLDLSALGEPVSWAGPEPAPVWLDVAREYTERWVHQRQIRDAVNRPGLKEREYLAPVLDTFVRALPHTFRRTKAPAGTVVKLVISGDAGGEWFLVRGEAKWELCKDGGTDLAAVVVIDQETAWRLFTRGIRKDQAATNVTFAGDRLLARKALDTVSIIA